MAKKFDPCDDLENKQRKLANKFAEVAKICGEVANKFLKPDKAREIQFNLAK